MKNLLFGCILVPIICCLCSCITLVTLPQLISNSFQISVPLASDGYTVITESERDSLRQELETKLDSKQGFGAEGFNTKDELRLNEKEVLALILAERKDINTSEVGIIITPENVKLKLTFASISQLIGETGISDINGKSLSEYYLTATIKVDAGKVEIVSLAADNTVLDAILANSIIYESINAEINKVLSVDSSGVRKAIRLEEDAIIIVYEISEV